MWNDWLPAEQAAEIRAGERRRRAARGSIADDVMPATQPPASFLILSCVMHSSMCGSLATAACMRRCCCRPPPAPLLERCGGASLVVPAVLRASHRLASLQRSRGVTPPWCGTWRRSGPLTRRSTASTPPRRPPCPTCRLPSGATWFPSPSRSCWLLAASDLLLPDSLRDVLILGFPVLATLAGLPRLTSLPGPPNTGLFAAPFLPTVSPMPPPCAALPACSLINARAEPDPATLTAFAALLLDIVLSCADDLVPQVAKSCGGCEVNDNRYVLVVVVVLVVRLPSSPLLRAARRHLGSASVKEPRAGAAGCLDCEGSGAAGVDERAPPSAPTPPAAPLQVRWAQQLHRLLRVHRRKLRWGGRKACYVASGCLCCRVACMCVGALSLALALGKGDLAVVSSPARSSAARCHARSPSPLHALCCIGPILITNHHRCLQHHHPLAPFLRYAAAARHGAFARLRGWVAGAVCCARLGRWPAHAWLFAFAKARWLQGLGRACVSGGRGRLVRGPRRGQACWLAPRRHTIPCSCVPLSSANPSARLPCLTHSTCTPHAPHACANTRRARRQRRGRGAAPGPRHSGAPLPPLLPAGRRRRDLG